MKPYGHKRSDSKTCKYGCCGVGKSNVANKHPSKRRAVDRAAKKRVRREGKVSE
jgi:hypothetical protein